MLLAIGVYAFCCSAGQPAHALDLLKRTIPLKSRLCMAGDVPCAARGTLERPAAAGEEPAYGDGIPNEELSLYKTISYVTAATLNDQVWYLVFASEAATTGGVFFVVNAATSAMMTYNYEYFWKICCEAAPGPDGVVPISATKAIIYRALSIVRVGALALVFRNTAASSAVVTVAITLSRTAVYVANDYVWYRVDARKRLGPSPIDEPTGIPWSPRLSARSGSAG
jgi:hypothetical protein